MKLNVALPSQLFVLPLHFLLKARHTDRRTPTPDHKQMTEISRVLLYYYDLVLTYLASHRKKNPIFIRLT